MSSDLNLDLHRFHLFVGQKLATGEASISPEDALDQWRAENRSPEEIADEIAAVREALEDMAQGDVGVPLVDFDRAFRQRHGLPAPS
jgi:hypothetical protein